MKTKQMERQIENDALYNDEEENQEKTGNFEGCLIYLGILLIIFGAVCLYIDKCAFESLLYMPKLCLYIIAG